MQFCRTLLLCCCLAVVQQGACQPYLRLRPSPSDNLPVKDIIEHPDPEQDPREQDLDDRALRKKLGSNFDPSFMAVVAPVQVNLSLQDPLPKPRAPGSLPGDLKKMDLSETPYGGRVKMGKKARRKFLQWLWAYTYCPVVYTWKDLGGRFWPRYIKEGNCFAERSCSFPEGMYCKPVKSVTKTFLRWYCQGWARQKYCTWIPIQYPIISECKCSC
ncbi:noggin-2-like [Rhinatrema bivittatum]|uniref:noggin-2-like n=1 Tax=Rhinatrema bivittatum TaxID=194408 RepID=UPI001125D5A5|nr:noggin-2-like [Rhinatrema bivittatum]